MISGTVTDPSGAPIPGVTVTVTGESGLTQTAATNGSGQYTVPSLPVGTYTAKFEIQGFKTLRSRRADRCRLRRRCDWTRQLEVGQLAETVTVSGAFEIIQRDTPDVGTTVSREYLTSLPFSMGGGRYPETFAYKMTPGVEGDTWTSRINGSPAFSKEVLLEGASVTTYLAGHFGESSVSMEALQEFKIQTSGLSAEFGRTAGGVFNFVMRSGQNQSHGTAFGTIRNEALNANTFLNNAAGRPKSRDRQNNFGGSFGGPVVIPGVYDGHDRTFFYRRSRKVQGSHLRVRRPEPIGTAARDVRRRPEPAADDDRRRQRRARATDLSRRHLRSSDAQRGERPVCRGSVPGQHDSGEPHQSALEAHRRHCEAALRADQLRADRQQSVSDSEHA